MQNGVEGTLQVDVVGHVMADEAEAFVAGQVRDIVGATRDEVVHCDDGVPFVQQPIAEMTTQETGAAGDQNSHGTVLSTMISADARN